MIRTALVLVLLVFGLFGETSRPSQMPAVSQIEHLHAASYQLATAPLTDETRLQRLEPTSAISGTELEDTSWLVPEPQTLPERRSWRPAAARAPPSLRQTPAHAYRSRAPPFDMI